MAIVIPYVKQTWTDGSGGGTPVSAARLGVIEEGILDVSQAPCVRAFHSVAQTSTTGVFLAVALDSERVDQAGGAASNMHDNATNNSRLTCRYAGVYQITGMIQFVANANGVRLAQIVLNGTTTIGRTEQWNTGGGDATAVMVTSLWPLAVNDYVQLNGYQNSGGNLDIQGANTTPGWSPEFMMVRVG